MGRSGDPGPRLVPSHPAAQAWGSWGMGRTKVTWGSLPPLTPPHSDGGQAVPGRPAHGLETSCRARVTQESERQVRLQWGKYRCWVGREAVMCKLAAEGEVGLGGECGGRASTCRGKAWVSGETAARAQSGSENSVWNGKQASTCPRLSNNLLPVSLPPALPNGSALSLLPPVTPLGRRGPTSPRSLCVAEPSAGWERRGLLGSKPPRSTEGPRPRGGPAVPGQRVRGNRACPGRPEPQAPVPGLPGTLQLLGPCAGSPFWSGEISSQALLLPTGEPRLPRPGLCPHITAAGTQRVPVAVGRRVAEAVHVLVEGGGHAVGLEHAEEGVRASAQQQADQLVVP